MPTVRSYCQPDFPPHLKWQAIAFMRVEWPFVFSGPGKFATETYPPELEPVHFVAAEGESLLSYAAILRLRLEHAGATYAVYGFGNMFTFPPYRRQGYGHQVLQIATAFIRQSDVDVAILFCDPALKGFYERCGWAACDAPTYIGPPESRHRHAALTMMLFVSEKGKSNRDAFTTEPLIIDEAW